ncbi:phage major capsid protein [Mesorhizobium sp. LHD-90]|uniref:phage major capsid family protein n=1 Tax=Mesorhizobium sp. LHD-90 TaxID=3071414 RepID=UPI0027E10DCD|nr:phage major capsid protein [Mesorhizobium sp. LHD-90]MDQ6437170.1 phage major capsid protein [Mesorhizobium sp. LHD-90]
MSTISQDSFDFAVTRLGNQIANVQQSLSALHKSARRGAERDSPFGDGDRFLKSIVCKALASPARPMETVWNDRYSKAATALGTTQVPQWLGLLDASDMLGFLSEGPAPALLPRLIAAGMEVDLAGETFGRVPFSIRLPAEPTASWIAEGQPIAVNAADLGSAVVQPKKVASITAISKEVVQRPRSEAIVAGLLRADIGDAVDLAVLSSDAATATVPGGIRAGIAALPAGASMSEDLKALTAAVLAAGGRAVMFIVNPVEAVALGSMPSPPPYLSSALLPPGIVIGLDPAAFIASFSGVTMDSSEEAVLHMASPSSPVVAAPAAPPLTMDDIAAPVRSMWQTFSLSLRIIARADWQIAAGRLAWVENASW